MIVYVEGPTCSGKTSVIKGLAKLQSLLDLHVTVVQQVDVLQSDLEDQILHMRRDEHKCLIAKQQPKSHLVLVDRSYLSTLVYNLTRAEVTVGYSAEPVVIWWLKELGTALTRPDVYLYIKADLNKCFLRAHRKRPQNSDNVWLHEMRRTVAWYERLFAGAESGIPVIQLNGSESLSKMIESAAFTLKKLYLRLKVP